MTKIDKMIKKLEINDDTFSNIRENGKIVILRITGMSNWPSDTFAIVQHSPTSIYLQPTWGATELCDIDYCKSFGRETFLREMDRRYSKCAITEAWQFDSMIEYHHFMIARLTYASRDAQSSQSEAGRGKQSTSTPQPPPPYFL